MKDVHDGSSTIVEQKKVEANKDDVLTSFFDESGDEKVNMTATVVDTESTDSDHWCSQLLDELESYLQTPNAP